MRILLATHCWFDRLLNAQAQLEHLQILTADGQLAAYEVDLLRA